MSSRKLRKQLATLVKKQGFGKLYYGNKKEAWKSLSSYQLKRMIGLLSFMPGDIVHDCDGFNHRLKNWQLERWNAGTIEVSQFVKEDGSWSCGCPYYTIKPRTAEEITRYWQEGWCDEKTVQKMKDDGWWGEKAQKIYDAIKEGRPICDENGLFIL